MKRYHTIQIARNFSSKNVDKTIDELNDFIFAVNYLSNAIYDGKVKVPSWQRYLEALLFKLTQHAGTLVEAVKGNNRQTHKRKKTMNYPDLASCYVVARAIMETYLMNYYLHFDSDDEDKNIFRMWLFEMSGLMRRQSYTVTGEMGVEKLAKEKLEIEELKDKIGSNEYFKSLDAKRQAKLLKGGEAKELSYEDVLSSRGVRNQHTFTLWKLYSNFAHSEYLSVLQLEEYINDRKETSRATITVMNQVIFTLAIQIVDLIENYRSAEIAFNALPTSLLSNIEVRIEMAKMHFFQPA